MHAQAIRGSHRFCCGFVLLNLFMLVFSPVCWSKPIDESTAQTVAATWMSAVSGIPHVPSRGNTAKQAVGTTATLYAVDLEPDGFVLVAADDLVHPILFYSDQGTYFHKSQPPAFVWMVAQAEAQVLEVSQNPSAALPDSAGLWESLKDGSFAPSQQKFIKSVSPLIQTTWDQGEFYNAQCPVDSNGPGGRVLVGCVATAMAQVMKYHAHPAVGTGSRSYSHPNYGTISANFSQATYNWSNMPLNLSSHNSDVARISFHAGVAVDMDYGAGTSGAYPEDVPSAMTSYFGYSSSIQRHDRNGFSTSSWLSLIRGDLDAQRPVIYYGYGSGGHMWVVDGYQGTDYFHCNWGWAGYYNGYFYLSDLAPGGSNFTNDQGAIIQISPVGGGGAKADLYDDGESYRTFSPTTIQPGQTLNISTDVGNGGSVSSGAYRVRFYASANTTISSSDYPLGYKDMGSLAANSWTNCDWSGTFPSNVPAGTYYIGWIIDSEGAVTESDENNNAAYKEGYQLIVQAAPTLPDLYDDGESFRSFSPTMIQPGQTLNISTDVGNGGPVSSGAYRVRFYASANTTISSSDYPLGYKDMGSLAANSWTNCDWSGTFPSSVPAGMYYVGWIIDSEGAVSESDENNNNAYKESYLLSVQVLPPRPDLEDVGESWSSFSPTSLYPGQALLINAGIRNRGDAAAGAYRVAFFASADSIISASDYLLGTIEMPSLSAGSIADCNWTGALPAAVPPGTYYIGWILDSTGAVTESSENNNSAYKASYLLTVQVPPPKPDLQDSGESWSNFNPTTAYPGQMIWGNAGIYNSGNAAAGAYRVVFFASSDTNITSTDYRLGSVDMPSLSSGASVNCSWSGVLPSIPVGIYYFGWMIDTQGVVSESNEANNTAYKIGYRLTVQSVPLQPDLQDAGETWRNFTPTSVPQGQTLAIRTYIRNTGNTASGSFRVNFFASTDTTISSSDYLIGGINMPAQSAGSWVQCNWSGAMPSSIPAGTYYVGWLIDSQGLVSESNESNNTAYKTGALLTVQSPLPKPDLVDAGDYWSNFSPSTIYPGQTLSVNAGIYNAGSATTGAYRVVFFASSDTSITSADYRLGSRDMPSLSSGSSSNCNWSGVLSFIPVGSYYVGWMIDTQGVVSESNENNNAAFKIGYQLTVQSVPLRPDLQDAGETWRNFTPTSVPQGQTLAVRTYIRNTGNTASGSFRVNFFASTDTTISSSDYLIGGVSMPAQSAGSWVQCNWSGAMPSSIPAGTYYVGWLIDSQGVVSESNEGNNTAYKTGALLSVQAALPKPDLVDAGDYWSNFSPTTINSGQTLSVNAGIYNAGQASAGAYRVVFYASSDSVITSSDYRLGSRDMPSLSSGGSILCSWSGPLPYVPAGSYYTGWLIDSTAAVAESNEANNVTCKTGYQLTVVGASGNIPVQIEPSDEDGLGQNSVVGLKTASGAYNLFRPDAETTLSLIGVPIAGAGVGEAAFLVYELSPDLKNASLAAFSHQVTAGSGERWCFSPEMNVLLEKGKVYAIGAAWSGAAELESLPTASHATTAGDLLGSVIVAPAGEAQMADQLFFGLNSEEVYPLLLQFDGMDD